jgi:hypothetical protein
MSNQHVGKDIGKKGVVHFDSLDTWVFEAKPFVVLDLQGIDERVYKYSLLDSIYTTFIVNDTVYVPFVKTEKKPDIPVLEDQFNLYFFAEKTRTKKYFPFPKNSSVKKLKDFIINKFADKDALRYGTETKLNVGLDHRELYQENVNLIEAKLKNNDVLYLEIIEPRADISSTTKTMASPPEQLKLNITGENFAKPIVKVNNAAVKSSRTREGVSIEMPANAAGGKFTISIQDGDNFYTHEMDVPKLKEATLDVNIMRKSAIKSINVQRIKAEQLQIKQ